MNSNRSGSRNLPWLHLCGLAVDSLARCTDQRMPSFALPALACPAHSPDDSQSPDRLGSIPARGQPFHLQNLTRLASIAQSRRPVTRTVAVAMSAIIL